MQFCLFKDSDGGSFFVYADYQEKDVKWEKIMEQKNDTMHDNIQSYQRDESAPQSEQSTHRKDKGAR